MQLTRISLPDGSATIGLPPGWRMTFGQNGAVDLEGSRGEQVSLGAAAPISTNPMARMAGMLVAPYSSPVQALQVLTPQISPKLARLGRPPVRLVRIVESAPAQYPGGQSAYVLYEADVGGRRYTALALIVTPPTGMQQWMYYTSVVSAPSEVFHGELPLLLQVWQSWSVSGETHMRRLQAAMRSMQQTAELARAAAAERTRAGLSTAEGWDQYIRGVQTVEHKGSGFRGEVENTKVDGLLRALNGSGTGNWRAVPPSELIPK